MTATLRDVPTPGEEVRQARQAQGLSQEDLARRAGVSAKTIGRIERGVDYENPRNLPAVRAALGLDAGADLSRIPAEALAAEVVRRLVAAEAILQRQRLISGDAPPDTINDPGTIAGPISEGNHPESSVDG